MSDSNLSDDTTPGAGASGEPRRHPLGFADVRSGGRGMSAGGGAPAVGRPSEAAYRTEISFRRTPGASVYASASGGGDPSDPSVVGHAESHPVDDELPVADEKVPFLKREITFGRKKTAPAAGAAESEATASTPFYKRELSLGRKKSEAETPAVEAPPVSVDVDVPLAETVAAGPVDARQAEEESVPFYKRELTFRRRKVGEPVLAGADVPALDVEPVTVDPEPAIDAATVELEVVAVDEPAELEVVAVDEPAELEPAEEPHVFDLDDVVEGETEAHPVAEVVSGSASEPEIAIGPEPEPEPGLSDAVGRVEAQETGEVTEAVAEAPARHRGQAAKTRTPKAKPARRGGAGRGRRILGLKIGASQIAAAVVQENEGRHDLVQLVRTPLAAGVVVDGEVRDRAALADALRTLFTENDLPRNNVRLGIASNRIGVRTIEIAGITDPARFDNAVRFKAHEVLPVAFHESVLDYRIVEEKPTESGDSLAKVLLVVAPRDQVEPYIDVLSEIGAKLTSIDLEALGLLRAFVEPMPLGSRVADDTATVLVSLGHESSTLLVSGAGICDFTRVFDWGAGVLEEAIAADLELPLPDAVEVLHSLSLGGNPKTLESLDADRRGRATEIVRARLTPFARELVSSLQFYQTQPDSLGIGEIVITGGAAHLDGLAEALHHMIGVTVRTGDPLGRVVAEATPDEDVLRTIGSMSVAIGLGIDDAPWRTVNLLPEELKSAKRKRPSLAVLAAPVVAAVALGGLGLSFLGARGDTSEQRARLDAVNAQIAALPEPTKASIDPALRGAEAERAQAVAVVIGSRVSWERVLGDISRVLPANVWLEHVTAQSAGTGSQLVAAPAVQTAPTGFKISGYTFTQSDVALLLARLQAVPSLARVTLESTDTAVVSTKKVVSFSILADLKGGS